MENMTLNARLAEGALDEGLALLYGKEKLEASHSRCEAVLAGFSKTFDAAAQYLFSAPGRTEIGGNHTDHQHGRVLAAAVDLDILAAAAKNGSDKICVQSEGYPMFEVSLSELEPKEEEKNTSASLVRGVAARMTEMGCKVEGLNVYMTSNVPGGSGLSSSAAFEVLFGTMFNALYFDNRCTAVEIAQIGQYAENVFFGKPCGLMDQTASSVGGVVGIDFADTAHPVVEQVALDLTANGYAMCILDSGADHADLTAEYAAITDELKAVSRHFGKEVLREIPEADFLAAVPELRKLAGDRGVLRAFHFYAENERAAEEVAAIRNHDFDAFLELVRSSGRSSALYLQNVIPTGQTKNQELMLTIALSECILGGRGAVRVHGGGFGGTAQAIVPLDLVEEFKQRTEAVLGEGSCHIVTIRPAGGYQLA